MKTANGVDKPLAEWTLKDVKDFCGLYTCNDCPIKHLVCDHGPSHWDLEEKPKFTAQEIEGESNEMIENISRKIWLADTSH